MGTWGNVSARCEGQDLMVITPSGFSYDLMTMEDLVIVDSESKVAEGRYQPSVETPLHMQIYRNRPDVRAIVHVHSLYATAFAVARQKIPVILEETAQVVGHEVPVADYARCGTSMLADSVVSSLGAEHRAVLLANHGLVAAGISMEEALKIACVVEKTARVAVYARGLGNVYSLEDADIEILKEKFTSYGQVKIPDRK